MSKVEKATSWMIGIANNNSHGYDQINRWGNPDYDCSSLVISAWEQAGVPVKSKGATYTGNMYSVFTACGFKDVTSSINLATGAGLKRGDVLLNTAYHTALSIGNGQLVHASSNENGGITGGRGGDQTGGEICVRSYYSRPWNYVLRFPESLPVIKAGNKVRLTTDIYWRTTYSTSAKQAGYVRFEDLSASAQSKSIKKDNKCMFESGNVVEILEAKVNDLKDTWIRVKNGWLPVIVDGTYRVEEA